VTDELSATQGKTAGTAIDTTVPHTVVARTSRGFLMPYHLRSPARFAPFFEGLELVDPGLVPVPHWRPDPGAEAVEIYSYCGVGRKR
jgi:hypothetical protein